MGIRTNIDITIQAGHDNNLAKVAFDGGLQQLLDTLDHSQSGSFTLEGGESNFAIPFGDVAQARLVYIESNGPLRITPGGGTATVAQRDSAGGSYPTGFDGTDDTFDFEVDGTEVNVEFESTDQSVTQVINRINAAIALLGLTGPGGIPITVARNTGMGQLRLTSSTTGTGSSINILSSTPAAVRTALGLSVGETLGANASPGQTPLTLMKPASTDSSDSAEDVLCYFLATLQTTALTIDNLDPDVAAEVKYLLVGDLVTTPACAC